jgi:glycosyltransferase involved in cell wall biosynthesis
MKILQLSRFDSRFGAAIATRRLHEALLAAGEQCDFLVDQMRGNSARTHVAYTGFGKLMARARLRLDFFPLQFCRDKNYNNFSLNWVPSPIVRRIDDFAPNVVHMHWCLNDFVPTPILPRIGRPLIWTFHDMWAFTGGCHYTGGCDRYYTECGSCPVIASNTENDISRCLWRQKSEVYPRIRNTLQVICPSRWLADLARNAPLLDGVTVHALPNPIDAAIFNPAPKRAARQLLNLPPDGPLLLMGTASTNDRRKGFDLLDEALKRYAAKPDAQPLGLVTLGVKTEASAVASGKLKMWNLDFINDEKRLAALYNAVDVVALPSREENLSNMLAEALSCGTPCLAFDIGGNGDLISHQVNGYLVMPNDTADMAEGIRWILSHFTDERREAVSEMAHGQVSYETVVPKFQEIYQSAIDRWATVTPA